MHQIWQPGSLLPGNKNVKSKDVPKYIPIQAKPNPQLQSSWVKNCEREKKWKWKPVGKGRPPGVKPVGKQLCGSFSAELTAALVCIFLQLADFCCCCWFLLESSSAAHSLLTDCCSSLHFYKTAHYCWFLLLLLISVVKQLCGSFTADCCSCLHFSTTAHYCWFLVHADSCSSLTFIQLPIYGAACHVSEALDVDHADCSSLHFYTIAHFCWFLVHTACVLHTTADWLL